MGDNNGSDKFLLGMAVGSAAYGKSGGGGGDTIFWIFVIGAVPMAALAPYLLMFLFLHPLKILLLVALVVFAIRFIRRANEAARLRMIAEQEEKMWRGRAERCGKDPEEYIRKARFAAKKGPERIYEENYRRYLTCADPSSFEPSYRCDGEEWDDPSYVLSYATQESIKMRVRTELGLSFKNLLEESHFCEQWGRSSTVEDNVVPFPQRD